MKVTGITSAGAVTAITALTLTTAVVPASAATGGPGGLWRSDGYNFIFSIKNGRLTSFQTTSISCLPGDIAATRLPGSPGAGVTRFGRKGRTELVVTRTGRGTARLLPLGSATPLELRRMRKLPARCTKPTPKDALTTFDIFWTAYAENYPFFGLRKVDWRAARAKYRPRVRPGTGDQKLYRILTKMIKPLGDAHTSVEAGDVGSFEGIRPGTRQGSRAFLVRTTKATDRYLGVPLRTWGNQAISYGDLPGGIGYLRINRFVAYQGTSEDDIFFVDDLAILDQALDTVFTSSRNRTMRGLIIDVRNNGGGFDGLGLHLASRLATKPYLAYAKAARGARTQRVMVRPAHKPIYRGPVAVLTSDLSVSAAETFTQATMGRTPAPTRIGSNTQGVFSDVLTSGLPNGWSFGFGNEVYTDGRGRSFEGPGIAPDLRTPVFTEYELTHNRDSALAKARQILR